MIKSDTCIRCEKAEPEWGSFLCKSCQQTLNTPNPPPRPEQGLPVVQRQPPHHNTPKRWPA